MVRAALSSALRHCAAETDDSLERVIATGDTDARISECGRSEKSGLGRLLSCETRDDVVAKLDMKHSIVCYS